MLPDKVRRLHLLGALDHPWVTRTSTIVTFAGVAVAAWKFVEHQLHGANAWTFISLAMVVRFFSMAAPW
jgi:hypothetical protein